MGSQPQRKRRKNRCKQARHPNARFLLKWLPSISNGLLTVTLPWWNVLSVREPARSLRSRACSGSRATPKGKRMPRFRANVGRHQTKRIGAWLEEKGETTRIDSAVFVISYNNPHHETFSPHFLSPHLFPPASLRYYITERIVPPSTRIVAPLT